MNHLIEMKPIGHVQSDVEKPPRHWSVSDIEGVLKIDGEYAEGLKDICPGQQIIVLFNFHKSKAFTPSHLCQTPPHKKKSMGVFSICSPVRPNPIGLSVLEVLKIQGTEIRVKGLDMLDQTPIIDIKPHITGVEEDNYSD